jgi:hypothetical protein
MSNLDNLRREQAARLLSQLQQTRATIEIVEALALSDDGWQHPATLERLERCQTLERTLAALLASRAGPIGRSNDPS